MYTLPCISYPQEGHTTNTLCGVCRTELADSLFSGIEEQGLVGALFNILLHPAHHRAHLFNLGKVCEVGHLVDLI